MEKTYILDVIDQKCGTVLRRKYGRRSSLLRAVRRWGGPTVNMELVNHQINKNRMVRLQVWMERVDD